MSRCSKCFSALILSVLLLQTVDSTCLAQQKRPAEAGLLMKGRAAYEDGLYGLAERCLREYLSGSGGQAENRDEAVRFLFNSLYQQKKIDDLKKLIEKEQARSDAGDDAGGIVFWRAAVLYADGSFKEAVSVLEGFEEKYSACKYAPKVLRLRSRLFQELGMKKEAMQACSLFDERYPGDPEVPDNLLVLGKLLLAESDPKQAVTVFARLAKLPVNARAVHDGQYWLGMAYADAGNPDLAVDVLWALGSNTNAVGDVRASAMFLVSELHQKAGQDEKATQALKEGMALAQTGELKQNAGLRLGLLLLEMKRIKEGIPLLKSYISSSPENPAAGAAQLRLAEALVESGDNEAAVKEFQQYLETFTNSVGCAQASKGKGWALINTEHFAEAAMSFTKAYELYDKTEEKEYCLFKVGDAQFANGQFKLASETYKGFVDKFPDSALVPAALFQMGECFAKSDMTDTAEATFVNLAEKYTSSPLAEQALLRVAQIKAEKGLLNAAIDDFTALMKKYPDGKFYADALHGRGIAHYQQWHFVEALKDFDLIADKYVSSKVAETAYFKRGICHYWLGRDETALSICEEFLKRYPESAWAADVIFWIAKFQYNQGRYEESEKNFVRFAENYKDHPLSDDALLRAGLAASGRNEFVRSNELLARMIKEYPESSKIAEARFAQGNALRQLGEFSAAILIFDELIKKYSDSDLVNPSWLHKGDCQFSLGAEDADRYKEAIGSYRVVANSSKADMGQVFKAEYMTGRCLEKLGRSTEAFEEQYYPKVIIRFFKCREEGIWLNKSAKEWFVRAVFNSADILEAGKDWRGAVNILERVVEAGVYAADEARARIKKIRSEHFWMFYE